MISCTNFYLVICDVHGLEAHESTSQMFILKVNHLFK